MRFTILSLAPLWMLAMTSQFAAAEIATEVVEYHDGDKTLEGYLAYPKGLTEKRPGILVVHEWSGHNKYVRRRAEQLAELGYVAFALDMYGKGILAKDAREASGLAGVFKGNRKLMRSRALAGLDVLRKNEHVDPKKLAAIGYCFGGTTVLELARAGTDLRGVVSFHGGLETSMPAAKDAIKAKLLILHGADDPFVPAKEVAGFEEEMKQAGTPYELVKYPGAVHSFTNPEAKQKGQAEYNKAADEQSWTAMKEFFKTIFAK